MIVRPEDYWMLNFKTPLDDDWSDEILEFMDELAVWR